MARALTAPVCPLFIHLSGPQTIMHYEDEARRFNLLSGFLIGALVGTGVGLLAGPVRQIKLPRRRRSRREVLAKQWSSLRSDAQRAARSAIETGSQRFTR